MNTTQRQHAENCLSCGSPETDRRGLCSPCYEKYRRERDKLPANQRERFDYELIAANLLAADARKATNVFAKIRERVAREFSPDEPAAAPDQTPPIQPVGRRKKTPPIPLGNPAVKRKKAE
jgi:hypothetical protein